ncbi:helix-turn-helix transcriptional regulator [Agaribacterium haliotis]|uniref:helix-turn-helix transcriptional regulator n=1 Tax=Agaribacterium haliotis TaxID=2013869 RepID=UPI000BB542CD|nr:YafY family protein [Agaribacterium haliotis]
MHPTHRLFSIIQVLRSARQPVLAQELAQQFEVSVRTIYRDIAELQNQHLPVVGEAGIGYVLKKGHDLPPLMLTPDELDAVLLGINWVSQRGDESLNKASKSLLNKIRDVVPEHLQSVILNEASLAPSYRQVFNDSLDMSRLREAIRRAQKIKIRYCNAQGESSERIIWPFMLAYFDVSRLICAWCEYRQNFRHFRSDRIAEISYLDQYFEPSSEELKKRWRKQQAECECPSSEKTPERTATTSRDKLVEMA